MRFILAIFALALGSAHAQEPIEIPKKYLIGIAPEEYAEQERQRLDLLHSEAVKAEKERPEVLLGTTYTVVAPIFNGSDGNLSYLRFGNANTTSNTTTISVVGATTGTVYGSTSYTIPPGASPQYSINDILTKCTTCKNITEAVSLYIRNPAFYTGYQHVIYNSSNGFFENASLCQFRSSLDYSSLTQLVVNVHTSRIVGYPAKILLHNFYNTSVTFRAVVVESQTGTAKGELLLTAIANGSYAIDGSYFEQQLGWSPGPAEFHFNVVFQPYSTVGYYGLVGQAIYNQQLQAYTNMSQICGINY